MPIRHCPILLGQRLKLAFKSIKTFNDRRQRASVKKRLQIDSHLGFPLASIRSRSSIVLSRYRLAFLNEPLRNSMTKQVFQINSLIRVIVYFATSPSSNYYEWPPATDHHWWFSDDSSAANGSLENLKSRWLQWLNVWWRCFRIRWLMTN